jgi:RimJ/RimL family protein N-acetyltransferase
MIELETNRLKMRMVRNDDLEQYARFYEEEQFARFVGGRKNKEQSWRSMALLAGHWHLMGFGYWALEEKQSGIFAGCTGLWKSYGWPEMELGYWIMPEYHGKGFASEAGQRAIDYAFNEMGRNTLVSYISPENEASKKVARGLGAFYEETMELLHFGAHEVWRYNKH